MRKLLSAAIVSAVAMAPSGAHAATGVAYIENNAVMVSTVDGATKLALVSDGTSTRVYESLAQTAAGHVFASIGDGATRSCSPSSTRSAQS